MEAGDSITHLKDGCTCIGKQCGRCKTPQCIEGFHRQASQPDGYRALCKVCRKTESGTEEFKAKRRKHHEDHIEEINEKKRGWYQSHPEQARQYSRNSRQKNIEKVREENRIRSRSERGKQLNREYRTRHPDRARQFTETWKDNHPTAAQEHAKVRAANYKSHKLDIPGKITTKQWRAIKTYYDNTCLRCRRQEPLITLTIDHVIPFALRGANDISNVQPLCEFCNISKGVKVIDYRTDYEEQNYG